MIRKVCFLAVVAAGMMSCQSEARAHDPAFGFLYGYSVGQSNQFRYRLPAPPYFAIYPPVYYGERFQRPYGESPFASWPMLSPNPAYAPEPKQDRVQVIANPYCCGAAANSTESTPVADSSMPRSVTVLNPYVTDAEDRLVSAEVVK